MPENISTKYALFSVSDKTEIAEFARTIANLGYRIISTGGTAKALAAAGIAVISISEITGEPESFDGRMKTISFQIESGILFDRGNPKHVEEAAALKIKPIDIVVCNLYPFEASPGIENIDVGGPTMIRAAAKNNKHVLVICDPADYAQVAEALKKDSVTPELRQELAAKAFWHLSHYDSQIAAFLERSKFPEKITLPGRKAFDLRYGENPHQRGAVYFAPRTDSPLARLKRLWGRELSLINMTDINAGIESVRLFVGPAAVVIKHNNPCGVALGKTAGEALARAIEADAESAFGGIVVLNKPMDEAAAAVVAKFRGDTHGNMDIIAAPEIDDGTLDALKKMRKSMGIYTFGDLPQNRSDKYNLKWIDGGFILQDSDDDIEKHFAKWEIVTKIKPTEQQMSQMKIAWKFISRIKSNAVIVVDATLPMTRGIGTGQTSRVRAAKIALSQAGEHGRGGIMASDSFFPFPDSVEEAASRGIAGIVQQGDSINDKAVIQAADAAKIPMVFTHTRAFWH